MCSSCCSSSSVCIVYPSAVPLGALQRLNVGAVEHDFGYPQSFHFFMVFQDTLDKLLVGRNPLLDGGEAYHTTRSSTCTTRVLRSSFIGNRNGCDTSLSLHGLLFRSGGKHRVQRFLGQGSNLYIFSLLLLLLLLGFGSLGTVAGALAHHIQAQVRLISSKQGVVKGTRVRSSCGLAKSPEKTNQRKGSSQDNCPDSFFTL